MIYLLKYISRLLVATLWIICGKLAILNYDLITKEDKNVGLLENHFLEQLFVL